MEPKKKFQPGEEEEPERIWRTHRCRDLSQADVGASLLLCGFVEARRDHKHQIFLHLRDGSGRLQVVFDGDRHPELAERASHVPLESVIQVSGRLVRRPPDALRTSLDTKTIELDAASILIVSQAPPAPFPLEPEPRRRVDEGLRLARRWFELRAADVQDALRGRAAMVRELRRSLEQEEFLEVETPLLTRESPEGAREFRVPSRMSPGRHFALAQSPQIYKQMLMVGGIERYFQVARCFRDEDGRANRQSEFTQLDLECAFPTEAEIRGVVERAVCRAASALGTILEAPFPVLTWEAAMARDGVDRPDLRFDFGLTDVTDLILASGFKKLRDAIRHGGAAGLFTLPLPAGRAPLTNAELDRVREEAMGLGAPGLLWFRREGDLLRSDPFVERILTEAERRRLAGRAPARGDGPVFLLAAQASRLPSLFSALRSRLAARFGLTCPGELRACWVARFPFFEPGGTRPSHHPFTSPRDPERFRDQFAPFFAAESARALPPEALAAAGSWPSHAYDLVINGEEIGSGSLRIHEPALQRLVFRMLGYSAPEMEEKFGFFLRALEAGAPPHGGIALGIDRLFLTLTGREDLREVIAFPKALDHSDPLTGAPA